jgi:hypothetical protein
MKQSFTLNQCLRLLYNETTPEESFMLMEIIEQNPRLKAEFERMQEAHRMLNESILSPSRRSVNIVRQYNRDSACITAGRR